MIPRYEGFEPTISYLDDAVDEQIEKLWLRFFERVSLAQLNADRAIWICSRQPTWVGVKPSGAYDGIEDEPAFVVNCMIEGLDAIVDPLNDIASSSSELIRLAEPHYKRYYRWLRRAIKSTFDSRKVQRLKIATISSRFGVYTTQVDDMHGSEIDEMDWLVGSRFRAK